MRAVDGLTGLPLRGLVALAFSANGAVAFSGSVSLDSDGKGEISSLPPGRYSLYLYSNGYATRSFTVQVPSPPLAAALTSGGRLEIRTENLVTGRLVDASGSTYRPFHSDSTVASMRTPRRSLEHRTRLVPVHRDERLRREVVPVHGNGRGDDDGRGPVAGYRACTGRRAALRLRLAARTTET